MSECVLEVHGDQFRCTSCGKPSRFQSRRNCTPFKAPTGPGSQLKELLLEVGISKNGNCGCGEFAAQMDAWGVDGCREHRTEIIEHLKTKSAERSWGEWWTAGRKAASLGIFSIPMLVDEAIRRASESPPSAQTR